MGGAGVLQRVCCRLGLLSLSVCLSSCLDCLFERAKSDFQMVTFLGVGAQTSIFSVRRVSVRALSVLVFSALRCDRRGWGKGIPMRLVPHIAILGSVVKACRCLWGENFGAYRRAVLLVRALGCGRRGRYRPVRRWGDFPKAAAGVHHAGET